MTTKRQQIVERPSGIGKILKGYETLTRARYRLAVTQEIIIARSLAGTTDEIPGLKDVRGQLTELDGQRDLASGPFTLELADGRRWEFFPTEGNPVSGVYEVVNSSGDGLPSLAAEN